MKKPVILLDLDETLVYSRQKLYNSITLEYEGRGEFTLIRPSAEAFLEELKSRNYIIMSLTQGVVPWQKAVLEAGNILHYFEDIYGWETTRRDSYTTPPLIECKYALVDNLSLRELEEKNRWIIEGGGEPLNYNNFIQCSEFWGVEEDSLLELLPRIEEILG